MKVYKAINEIQKALSKTGILKSRTNQTQGYSFRGIDDVYNALAPLLAEHELCILPRVLARSQTERAAKSGGIIFCVVVDAEFDFVSTADGSKHTIKMFGEAMDSADKATNKALSAAFKYACLQAFSIPTEADNDADAHTHEVAAPMHIHNPQTAPQVAQVSEAAKKVFAPKKAAAVTLDHQDPSLGTTRVVITGASKPKDFDGISSFGFVGNDVWYNTSNEDHVAVLNKSKASKMPVIITFKSKGKYKYIQAVSLVETPEQLAGKSDEPQDEVIEAVPF